MTDRLVIDELETNCRIGLTEQERQKPQPVWIDLELAIDVRKAARNDAVTDTVDYARLVDGVRQLVEGKSYRLLETMAEEVADFILGFGNSSQVLVRVKKRALPRIGFAAVEIVRVH